MTFQGYTATAFARAKKKETLQEVFFLGTLLKDPIAIVQNKSGSEPLFLVPLLALNYTFYTKVIKTNIFSLPSFHKFARRGSE